MSMAARAISSRAVSSISLAGIGGMLEELHPSIFSALASLLRQRLSSIFSALASLLRQRLSSIFSALASPLRQRLSSIFSALASPLRQRLSSNCGPSPLEGRGEGLALVLALVAAELVLDGVDQRLPGGLDDVVGHPYRTPRVVAVAGGDEHARTGGGALALVEDADFVVEQAHLPEARIEVLECLAEGVVERVDGAVARGRGVFGDPLDLES